jgi:hypothetical protein
LRQRVAGERPRAARFNGAKGAAPVAIDGDVGGAWFMRGTVKVAFVFHVEAGRVREIELIADPEILATLHMTRRRLPRRPRNPLPSSHQSAPGSDVTVTADGHSTERGTHAR